MTREEKLQTVLMGNKESAGSSGQELKKKLHVKDELKPQPVKEIGGGVIMVEKYA